MGEWLSGNYLDGCCRLKWGKKFVRLEATTNRVGYGSYQHEGPVKLQDRWAEDKGIWVGRSHLYFVLIGKQKQGRAANFFEGRTRFATDWAQKLPSLNWSRTDQSSQLLRFLPGPVGLPFSET